MLCFMVENQLNSVIMVKWGKRSAAEHLSGMCRIFLHDSDQTCIDFCRWFQRSCSVSDIQTGLQYSHQSHGGATEPQAAADIPGELRVSQRRRHQTRHSGSSHHCQHRVWIDWMVVVCSCDRLSFPRHQGSCSDPRLRNMNLKQRCAEFSIKSPQEMVLLCMFNDCLSGVWWKVKQETQAFCHGGVLMKYGSISKPSSLLSESRWWQLFPCLLHCWAFIAWCRSQFVTVFGQIFLHCDLEAFAAQSLNVDRKACHYVQKQRRSFTDALFGCWMSGPHVEPQEVVNPLFCCRWQLLDDPSQSYACSCCDSTCLWRTDAMMDGTWSCCHVVGREH